MYVRDGLSNIRIGMFLEIATTLGALLGAYLVARVSTGAIGIVLASSFFIRIGFVARIPAAPETPHPDSLADGCNSRLVS